MPKHKKITISSDFSSQDLDRIGNNCVKKLSNIKSGYEQNKIDKISCLQDAVGALEEFFMVKTIKDTDASTSWISDLLDEELNSKIGTIATKAEKGAFVECLVLFGASRIQAMEASAEWLGVSKTSIRDAHKYFRDSVSDVDIDIDDILHTYYEEFSSMVTRVNKGFSLDFPKALVAFESFKSKLSLLEKTEES